MKNKAQPPATDLKRLKELLTRVNKRDLKPEDYQLLEGIIDKVESLRHAVKNNVSERALERLIRSMFGKKP
jgi:hypothetical protein